MGKLGGSLVDGGGAVSEPQNFVGILVSYIISLLFSAVEGVLERPLQNRKFKDHCTMCSLGH